MVNVDTNTIRLKITTNFWTQILMRQKIYCAFTYFCINIYIYYLMSTFIFRVTFIYIVSACTVTVR